MNRKKPSRRRFLGLLAVASVSAATLTTPSGAATTRRRRRAPASAPPPPESARPASVREEVRKQKGYLDAALKVIREYPLPPGGDPAFAFHVLPPAPRVRLRRSPARPLPGGER